MTLTLSMMIPPYLDCDVSQALNHATGQAAVDLGGDGVDSLPRDTAHDNDGNGGKPPRPVAVRVGAGGIPVLFVAPSTAPSTTPLAMKQRLTGAHVDEARVPLMLLKA